jgi:hypothetical protein
VRSLKAIYAGAKDASGRLYFSGFYMPGSEERRDGAPGLTGAMPAPQHWLFSSGSQFFQPIWFMEKADWDYRTFQTFAADSKTGKKPKNSYGCSTQSILI